MKQTNHAITFLMAQYRSVLENARILVGNTFFAPSTPDGIHTSASNIINCTSSEQNNTDHLKDKQGHTALNFLISQFRGIFAKGSHAFLVPVSIATIALSSPAVAVDRSWDEIEKVSSGDVLKALSDGFATTDKEFDITLDSAGNVIKQGKYQVYYTAEKGSITVNGNNASLAIGDSSSGGTGLVLKEFNLINGEVTLDGFKEDEHNDASLTAKTIKLGGETSTGATFKVLGWAGLHATGTSAGEGVTVGKNAKLIVGNSNRTAKVTGNIHVNGGIIEGGSPSAIRAIIGDVDSIMTIDDGEITTQADRDCRIESREVYLNGTGLIRPTASNFGSTINIAGIFYGNGGSISVSGNSTVSAQSNSYLSGTKLINNGGKIEFLGDVTFADNTFDTSTSGTISFQARNASDIRTVKLSSQEFKNALNWTIKTSASRDDVGQVVFDMSVDEEKIIDLSSSGLNLIQDNGTLSAKIDTRENGNIAFKGISGRYTAFNAIDAGKTDFNKNRLALSFDNLTLGSGDFTIKSGTAVEVGKLLKIHDGSSLLTVDNSAIILNGQDGEIKGNINFSGGQADKTTLHVQHGSWRVGDIELSKGQGLIDIGAALDVGGTLSIANTGSKLTLDSAVLNFQNGGKISVGSSAEDNSLALKNRSVLKLEASNVLKGKSLDPNAIAPGKINVDHSSIIEINNKKEDALNFSELNSLLSALGSNFNGILKIEIAHDIPSGKLTTQHAIPNIYCDLYNSKTLHIDAAKDHIKKLYLVGNIKVDSTEDLNLYKDGGLYLSNAYADEASENGYFITKKDSSGNDVLGGVMFNDPTNTLNINSSGIIGSISTQGQKTKGNLYIGHYEASTPSKVTIAKGNSIGAEDKALALVKVNETSSLIIENGNLFADQVRVEEHGSIEAGGKIVTKELDFAGKSINAESIIIHDIHYVTLAPQKIRGNATVNVGTFHLGKNTDMFLGDGGSNSSSGGDADHGSYAQIFVDKLILSQYSSLYLDPNYGAKASLIVAKDLTENAAAATNGVSLLNATVGIGRNSALSVGLSKDNFNDLMHDYLVDNGGFSNPNDKDFNGVANALVLNKPLELKYPGGIVLDSSLVTDINNPPYIQEGKITLGNGSALILTKNAFGKNLDQPAIKFNTGVQLVVADSNRGVGSSVPRIILIGDFYEGQEIFLTNGRTLGKFDIEALGGVLYCNLEDGSGSFKLKYNGNLMPPLYEYVSYPAVELIEDRVRSRLPQKDSGFDFVGELFAAKEYRTIDAAIHALTFAGAQQASLSTVSTMTDAILSRTSKLLRTSKSITATGSQENGGIWVTPMYKTSNADGFNAQGVTYGADVDLAGVAFGNDGVRDAWRYGTVFNIGSGDSHGKDQGSGIKDEFFYCGFGLYAAYSLDQVSLIADASVSGIFHDVHQSTNSERFGKLSAQTDTLAASVGLTGQISVSTPVADITPHFGARFTHLDTHEHDLDSTTSRIATTSYGMLNVFSMPIGVSVSNSYDFDGWSLAPQADLTVTFNSGDTEIASQTSIGGKTYAMTTEVLNEVTYSLSLGFDAKFGSFGSSLGVNYTGAENSDSIGIRATGSYAF